VICCSGLLRRSSVMLLLIFPTFSGERKIWNMEERILKWTVRSELIHLALLTLTMSPMCIGPVWPIEIFFLIMFDLKKYCLILFNNTI
jgi:hypothetical protein